jgi:general secretion pathway protein L
MAALQIYLRDDEPGDNPALAGRSADWVLREPRGRILSEGNNAFAEMPAADRVDVVVPASRVLFTRVNLPPANATKTRQLLPFAIEDKLLANPESIHAIAGTRELNGETPVAVVDKTWVNQVMARLLEAKITPQSLVPETTLPPLPSDGWSMVWDGSSGFVRTGEMSGLSLDGGDGDGPPLGLILALDEARAKNAAPQKIILLSPDNEHLTNFASWTETLGVPVVAGGAWSNAHANPQSSGINFLQGDYASSGNMSNAMRLAKPLWILAALIAALHIGATIVDWAMLKYQKNAAQSSMVERFKKVFPESKVIVDAPLQMSRNLADLRRAAGVSDASDFLPLAAAYSGALAGVPNARTTTMQYEKGRLQVDVALPDAQAAENLRGKLQAAKLSVKLEATNPKTDGVDARFSLSGGAP